MRSRVGPDTVVMKVVPKEEWTATDREDIEYGKTVQKDGILYGERVPKHGEPVRPSDRMMKIKVLSGPEMGLFVTEDVEGPEAGTRGIGVYPAGTTPGPKTAGEMSEWAIEQRMMVIPRLSLEWWIEFLKGAGRPVRAVLNTAEDLGLGSSGPSIGMMQMPEGLGKVLAEILQGKKKRTSSDDLIDMMPGMGGKGEH